MFVNSNYLYVGSHALLLRPLKKQTFFLVFNIPYLFEYGNDVKNAAFSQLKVK